MKGMHCVSYTLLVIGGLNWGLVGIGQYMGNNLNVVNLLLGSWPAVEALVYLLVGIAAVISMFTHKKNCALCGACQAPASAATM